MNQAAIEKHGDRIQFGDLSWPAGGEMAKLADGRFTVGVRPHFITPDKKARGAVRMSGRVEITELSGSESVAHFAISDTVWVSLSAGAHPFKVGETHEFFLDPTHCYYFDLSGQLVATGGGHG